MTNRPDPLEMNLSAQGEVSLTLKQLEALLQSTNDRLTRLTHEESQMVEALLTEEAYSEIHFYLNYLLQDELVFDQNKTLVYLSHEVLRTRESLNVFCTHRRNQYDGSKRQYVGRMKFGGSGKHSYFIPEGNLIAIPFSLSASLVEGDNVNLRARIQALPEYNDNYFELKIPDKMGIFLIRKSGNFVFTVGENLYIQYLVDRRKLSEEE